MFPTLFASVTLQAGEIDIVEEIPPDMMTLLKGNTEGGNCRSRPRCRA